MPHVFDYQMFNIHKPDQPPIEVSGISVLGYGILDSLILSCSQVGTRISQTFGSPWQSNSSTGGGSKAEGDDSLCIFYCNPVYPYKGAFCHGSMLRIQPPLATVFLLAAPQVFHDAKVETRAIRVQLLQTRGLSHVLLVAMLGECWISSKFTEKKPKK